MSNPITQAYRAHHAAAAEAERADKKTRLAAMPDAAIERHANALAVFRQYKGADAITRAHIRQNFADLELGRQLDDLDPEPPKAA